MIYASNISPHPEAGIGGWSEQDLVTALREGQSREGAPYYPAFPYTSYTHMTREDISDLYTWIMAQEPTDTIPPENEPRFPLFGSHGDRGLAVAGRTRAVPARS